MTPELIALGKRAIACRGWRWVAGMLVYALPDEPDDIGAGIGLGITMAAGERPRVVSVRDGCVTLAWEAGAGDAEGGTLLSDDIPDLSDPATLGCLLALVREALGGDVWTQGALCYPTITSANNPPTRSTGRLRWVLGGMHRDSSLRLAGVEGYDSEAGALVNALEHAP